MASSSSSSASFVSLSGGAPSADAASPPALLSVEGVSAGVSAGLSAGASALSSLAEYLSCAVWPSGDALSLPPGGAPPWPPTLAAPRLGRLTGARGGALGEGSAGYVLRARAADGAEYAAKVVLAQSPEARLAVRREVEAHLALAAARAPHAMPLLDWAFERVPGAGGASDDDAVERALLVMPLCGRGSLAAALGGVPTLTKKSGKRRFSANSASFLQFGRAAYSALTQIMTADEAVMPAAMAPSRPVPAAAAAPDMRSVSSQTL